MTQTVISLDNGETVYTEMVYSDVIKSLVHARKLGVYVEFYDLLADEKVAVSPAHVAAVR